MNNTILTRGETQNGDIPNSQSTTEYGLNYREKEYPEHIIIPGNAKSNQKGLQSAHSLTSQSCAGETDKKKHQIKCRKTAR